MKLKFLFLIFSFFVSSNLFSSYRVGQSLSVSCRDGQVNATVSSQDRRGDIRDSDPQMLKYGYGLSLFDFITLAKAKNNIGLDEKNYDLWRDLWLDDLIQFMKETVASKLPEYIENCKNLVNESLADILPNDLIVICKEYVNEEIPTYNGSIFAIFKKIYEQNKIANPILQQPIISNEDQRNKTNSVANENLQNDQFAVTPIITTTTDPKHDSSSNIPKIGNQNDSIVSSEINNDPVQKEQDEKPKRKKTCDALSDACIIS